MQSIFIGGYMHSGTSMLVNIIKQHSEIYAVGNELRLFESYPSFNHSHGRNQKYFKSILKKLRLSEDEQAYIEVRKNTLLEETSTIGQLTIRMVQLLKEFNGNLYWAEKTPSNVYFIDEIFKKFPDSKIIVIHRDIRSIIASKKLRTLDLKTGRYSAKKIEAKKLEKDWNIVADSFSWLGTIKAQARALSKYDNRIFLVQYEKFVQNPLEEWKRICDFLGVTYEENCLDIKFRNSAIRSDGNKLGGVIASQTNWSGILSEREIKLANAINGDKLKSLGYPVTDYNNYFNIACYFLMDLPGVFNRIIKRYRGFSLGYFYVYFKSMRKRF